MKEPGKLVKIHLEECEHGQIHDNVTVEDIEIDRRDNGDVHITDSSGVLVGFSSRYAANWDANFGDRDVKPENLN